MKKLFGYIHQWGLIISVGLAMLVSLTYQHYNEISSHLINEFICNLYFYENYNCPADDYSVFISNFMAVSIITLTSGYLLILIISGFYSLSGGLSDKKRIPLQITIFKHNSIQLFVSLVGLYIFWGVGGVSYFDATLVAVLNTICIWLLYTLALGWILELLNQIVKKEI